MFKAQIPYAPYFYLQIKVGCNTMAKKSDSSAAQGSMAPEGREAAAAVSLLLLASAAVQGSM